MTTIEYRVMVACREKLVAGVKTGVDPLADVLFQEGILSDDLRDQVQASLSHMTQEQKAREIVSTLETWVKDFGPAKYTLFVTILRRKSILFPQFGVLAGQLEDKMAELKTAEPHLDAGELQSLKTYDSKESEQNEDSYIRFECACGECTIQEFLNERDCPNLPSKGPPQLSMWTKVSSRRVPTQADMQWSLYRVETSQQAATMNSKYRALLSSTINELKQKCSLITAKDKVRSLLTPQGANKSMYSRMYNRDMKGRLRDVMTYDQLEKYLDNNFCSWFNINLIADLREALLATDYHSGDEAVATYRESLALHMKRLCFKRTVNENKNRCTEFVCKVPTNLNNVKEKQVDIIEHELRQHIRFPESKRRVENDLLIFKVNRNEHRQSTGERALSHSNTMDLESGVQNPPKRLCTCTRKDWKPLCVVAITLLVALISSNLIGKFYIPLPLQYQHNNLGSSRVYSHTTILASNVSVSNLRNEDSLIFSKPGTNRKSTMYIKDCHLEQTLGKCEIVATSENCIIPRSKFANQMKVCIVAQAAADDSSAYISYGIQKAYITVGMKTFFIILLVVNIISSCTMFGGIGILYTRCHLPQKLGMLLAIIWNCIIAPILFVYGLYNIISSLVIIFSF